MQSFEAIKDVLIKHLPRPAVGSPVTITDREIAVGGEGISLGDVAHFLSDLTGKPDFLPDDLPVRNIRLTELHLTNTGDLWSWDFDFKLYWDAADLTLIEGVPLALRKAEVTFAKHGQELLATGDLTLLIDDYEVSASLELPSKLVRARIADIAADEAGELLAARGLSTAGQGMILRALSVDASFLFRRVHTHLELENLFEIGPVRMPRASATVVLTDDPDDARAEVRAELEIDRGKKPAVAIQASGQIDRTGWKVRGEVETKHLGFKLPELMASLTDQLGLPAPTLPDPIAKLGIQKLALALDTRDHSFSLDCVLDWQKPGSNLVLHVDKSTDALTVTASLVLGDLVFRVAFVDGKAPVFVAVFEAAGARGLTLQTLLSAVGGEDIAKAIEGAGLDLGIKAAALALDNREKILLATEIAAGIDLSKLGDLPLFGTLMPNDAELGMTLTALFQSKGFDGGALAVARDQMAAIELPEKIPDDLSVVATLELGGEPIHVDLGSTSGALDSATAPDVADSAGPPATTPTLEWTEIDKSIGPIHLSRFGYAMTTSPDHAIDIALDGSLSIAGLTVDLDGLGARYDFDTKTVTPHLQGLSIDFKQGPLEIGGAFLNNNGDFAGGLTIGTEKFALHAMGAFTMLDGAPSMFAYGVLDMPLGGPPFFFVEGLAAGFGVHRKMRMPEISEVHSHPLIAGASAGPPPQGTVDPGSELRKLHDFVTPKLGEYFFAAGVKFNSFRLLHGFGVVIVSLGDSFEVDLIGTATFSTPPDLPPEIPAFARVELDLIARFAPSEGLCQVEARLNPKSYVYGPMCHLSGGFAFYSWFTGERAGDFVLSIGGYHPDFVPPEGYPDVPRVELKYQVTPEVYLKGDAYFALTPSAVMAGGSLHAQVNIDALHAWADLTVDFLMTWEPFHYDARVHIEVGAEWKVFSTTAAADLHIWGPKFGGIAKVDWSVFSFDVDFGGGTPRPPAKMKPEAFKASFLDVSGPGDENNILGAVIAAGTIGTTPDGHPIVADRGLKFGISSRVPIAKAQVTQKRVAAVAQDKLHLAPMGGGALGTSDLTVAINHIGHGPLKDKFTVRAVASQFPSALWGSKFYADVNGKPIKAVGELELVPKVEVTHQHSQMKLAKDLWESDPLVITHDGKAPAPIPAPTPTPPVDEVPPPPPAPPAPSPDGRYEVVLESIRLRRARRRRRVVGLGGSIAAIQLVRRFRPDLSTVEATALIATTPVTLIADASVREAARAQRAFRQIGGKITLNLLETAVAEPASEDGVFNVVLEAMGTRSQKVAIIKEVRGLKKGRNLKDAVDMTNNVPVVVLSNVSFKAATKAKEALEDAGASASLSSVSEAAIAAPSPIGRSPQPQLLAEPASSTRPVSQAAVLILEGYKNRHKTKVANELRRIGDLTHKEARALIEAAPRRVDIALGTLEEAKASLEAAGGIVTLQSGSRGGHATPGQGAPLAGDFPTQDLAALGLALEEATTPLFDLILMDGAGDMPKMTTAVAQTLSIDKEVAKALLQHPDGHIAQGVSAQVATGLASDLRQAGANVWQVRSLGAHRPRSRNSVTYIGGATEAAHV